MPAGGERTSAFISLVVFSSSLPGFLSSSSIPPSGDWPTTRSFEPARPLFCYISRPAVCERASTLRWADTRGCRPLPLRQTEAGFFCSRDDRDCAVAHSLSRFLAPRRRRTAQYKGYKLRTMAWTWLAKPASSLGKSLPKRCGRRRGMERRERMKPACQLATPQQSWR